MPAVLRILDLVLNKSQTCTADSHCAWSWSVSEVIWGSCMLQRFSYLSFRCWSIHRIALWFCNLSFQWWSIHRLKLRFYDLFCQCVCVCVCVCCTVRVSTEAFTDLNCGSPVSRFSAETVTNRHALRFSELSFQWGRIRRLALRQHTLIYCFIAETRFADLQCLSLILHFSADALTVLCCGSLSPHFSADSFADLFCGSLNSLFQCWRSQSCTVVLWSLVSVLTHSRSSSVVLSTLRFSADAVTVFHCESLISRFSADEVTVFHCESLISRFSADEVPVFHCGSLISRFSADAVTFFHCESLISRFSADAVIVFHSGSLICRFSAETFRVFLCESLISRFNADAVTVFHCESLISSFSADAVTVFHCESLISRFSAEAFTDLHCRRRLCFHVRHEVYQQLLRLWHHPELCRWHRWWYYLLWVDGNGDNGCDVDDDDHWKW